MAINATFESDFSNFIAGLARAEAALNKFAEGTEKYTKQAKAAEQSTSFFKDALSTAPGMLAAFGINLSVEALFNFAKGAVESAAALGDLATATGISTDELQKMKYAGQGFGLSLETISGAVQKLSADLASSSPNSAKSAVEALGMRPDQLHAAGEAENLR